MDISCAFATSMKTPEHVVIAEELGYRRAWLYDSPALYPEIFMTLARSAERTTRIGLGTGVLIPSLRHPMTVAASIATLAGVESPRTRDRAPIAEGASNLDIAQRLFVSRKTIERHVSNIFVKRGVKNRAQLAAQSAERQHGTSAPS